MFFDENAFQLFKVLSYFTLSGHYRVFLVFRLELTGVLYLSTTIFELSSEFVILIDTVKPVTEGHV